MSATTMNAGSEHAPAPRPRVYHVSPWRMFWGWVPFAPFAVGCAFGALFADTPDTRAGLLIAAACFALTTWGIVAMIRRARVEIRPEGIVLRQIGFRLESPWSNVVAIRTDRGREGFVTAEPVTGKGLNTLAAATSLDPYGMYDDLQQQLIEEHRLIPIEAFAWHLRSGMMRRDVRGYAPHLASDLYRLTLKPEKKPFDWRLFWLVTGLIAMSIAIAGAAIWFGDPAAAVVATVANVVYAIVSPLMAVSSALATWQMYKRRSWLFTILMALMTLVMVGWTLVDWGRLLA